MTAAGRYLQHDGPTIVADHFGFIENPAPTVERAFQAVYLHRMQDIPLCNHALRVEALGFRRTDDGWLGVVVTPWFMNLVLIPARGARWTHMLPGAKRVHRFASGAYELFGNEEDGVGEYQYCSLFSPMGGFSAHDEARAVAQAALDLLIDADTARKVEALARGENQEVEQDPQLRREAQPPDPGKRNFLRGHFIHTRR
jgi:[NiFe] hydrogenase assembly HybE family chaperone